MIFPGGMKGEGKSILFETERIHLALVFYNEITQAGFVETLPDTQPLTD